MNDNNNYISLSKYIFSFAIYYILYIIVWLLIKPILFENVDYHFNNIVNPDIEETETKNDIILNISKLLLLEPVEKPKRNLQLWFILVYVIGIYIILVILKYLVMLFCFCYVFFILRKGFIEENTPNVNFFEETFVIYINQNSDFLFEVLSITIALLSIIIIIINVTRLTLDKFNTEIIINAFMIFVLFVIPLYWSCKKILTFLINKNT